MQEKFKILKPHYFDAFCCIGAKCEDNCCQRDWRIDVDKRVYARFQNLSDEKWRQTFNKNITINKTAGHNDDNYAQINLHDNCCPFLDKESHCSIERALGKIYSPLVCQTYPRIYNVINGMLEKSLALSCPEAARIVLQNSDIIKFVEAEEDFYVFNILSNILDTGEIDLLHEPQRYFWELRIFIISLLQNRSYALWERLAILGSFFETLREGDPEGIPALIADYNLRLKQRGFTRFILGIPSQITIEIKILKKLFTMPDYFTSLSFAECLAEALCGFGVKDRHSLGELEISLYYAKAYYDYYCPVMAEYGYMLENYLVNHVFMSLFPFDEDKNIFDNYIYLIIHYSLIKILLVGIAGFYKEKFNQDRIIKLLYSFAHAVEQYPFYLDDTFDFLNDKKLADLHSLAILLKN